MIDMSYIQLIAIYWHSMSDNLDKRFSVETSRDVLSFEFG